MWIIDKIFGALFSMNTNTAALAVVGIVVILAFVLVMPILLLPDKQKKRELAIYGKYLKGAVAGPFYAPYFAGVYRDLAFTITERNVRMPDRNNAWKGVDQSRITLAVRTGFKMRILNREAVISPMLYRWTLTKRIKTGIEALDDNWIVYTEGRDDALAMLNNSSFVAAVSGIFKLPYDRLDIEQYGIEIRERHACPADTGSNLKEKTETALEKLFALAGLLHG